MHYVKHSSRARSKRQTFPCIAFFLTTVPKIASMKGNKVPGIRDRTELRHSLEGDMVHLEDGSVLGLDSLQEAGLGQHEGEALGGGQLVVGARLRLLLHKLGQVTLQTTFSTSDSAAPDRVPFQKAEDVTCSDNVDRSAGEKM